VRPFYFTHRVTIPPCAQKKIDPAATRQS
jgi:hypothetical protein